MSSGQVSNDVEIRVPASFAWELFGGLQLGKLVEKELPTVFEKIEVEEGDGGLGTVLKLTFVPGRTGFTTYKEKFTKVDNEKLVKEAEVVEGGYLDLGFTLYRIRLKVLKKNEDSCIIRSTIEYEVKEEAIANASIVSIELLTNIIEVSKNYLIKKYIN